MHKKLSTVLFGQGRRSILSLLYGQSSYYTVRLKGAIRLSDLVFFSSARALRRREFGLMKDVTWILLGLSVPAKSAWYPL
jgi:hypothetical protein